MPLEVNELSQNSRGGTELMLGWLYESVDPTLLEPFQIVPSRVRTLDPDRIRVLWMHLAAHHMEAQHLADGGWARFDKIVFVSNTQMQAFIARFGIPWSRCAVMQNAIDPIELHTKPTGAIRLIYTSMPDRGLVLLVPVFDALAHKYPEIELEVFSSYRLYGWAEADAPLKPLFDACEAHPRIHYHGAVSNGEVREALKSAHIFSYPCIMLEPAPLTLMEAMSAGLLCVHPNLGGMYEIAANWTRMYAWHEEPAAHAQRFAVALDDAIATLREPATQERLAAQKHYADLVYSRDRRKHEWTVLLNDLLRSGRVRSEN